MSADPVVDCRDLFRLHRTREGDAAALQGLTLTVAAGEAVACLGPSGSGKSTLLRVLAGLEAPSAGRALVFGTDLSRVRPRERAHLRRDALGLVGQHGDRALPPDLTIRDAVALPLTLRGQGMAAARRTAAEHLARVGLADAGGARPDELSGGERQRAAIAAAVAHGPRLLLADEPTGELDAASAAVVLLLLREVAGERGMAMLLVTHDPVTAAAMDRRVHVRDGKVSDEDTGGGAAVVVDRGGWLRVPAETLRAAGITDRAIARAEDGRVVLEPVSASGGGVAPPAPARPDLPAAAPGGPAVVGAEVRGLRRAYGPRVVLDGLDAEWAPGTFTVVTGRSGTGKSTLLRLLCGLEPPDAGAVRVGTTDVGALDRAGRAALRARDIAYVGQGDVLLPHLGPAEQPGPAPALVTPWLRTVGLGARLRQPVGRLSGGERRRAAIARALASGRGLVVLDEPTSALDEAGADALGALLRAVAREHGRTVVCATHDPVLAAHSGGELALGGRPLGRRSSPGQGRGAE